MLKGKLSGKHPSYGHWLPALFALCLTVWKISLGLEKQMDIRFYDESYYLTQGLFHPINSWIPDYSPLYSLYYKAMGFLFEDGFSLYYASYRFWDLILGCVVYGILRLSGISFIPALLWGMSACASQLGLPLWPKAGHLAMAGTSIGVAGLWHWRNKIAYQLIWISGTCLLLSWCRPEFLAGAALAIPSAIYYSFRNNNQLKSLAWLPSLLCLVFVFVWGIPAGQSGRGMVAFGQHFVHNWRNISGINTGDLMWDWVNWRPVFQQHFGAASSLAEAFFSNPADMLLHFWFNLRYLFYNGLVYFSETLFPKRLYGFPPLAGIVSLWFVSEFLNSFKPGEKFLDAIRKQGFLGMLPWIFLAIPSLLAGLLFQPRPHYILPLLPLFVLAAGLYFKNVSFVFQTKKWKNALFALPLILFFMLPDCRAFFQIQVDGGRSTNETHPGTGDPFGPVTSKNLSHKILVNQLLQFPFPEGFRIFDASTGATEYLGDRLIQCGKTGFEMNYPALQDFSRFLDSAKVQGIFLHETIRYDRFFKLNPDWQKIKSQPQKWGWRKIPVGTAGDSLLLREQI